MILHLILSATLLHQTLSQRIGLRPSGRNGYEEYVAAAEIVEKPEFRLFLDAIDLRTPTNDSSALPPGVHVGDSSLTIRRKFVARFGGCLTLLREGNEKPCWDPRQNVEPMTQFPELMSFKSLARLESAAAELAFADGQNALAIERLKESMTFARRISTGMLINRLVGIACESISLMELARHYRQLSQPDADDMSGFLADLLKQPSPLPTTFEVEAKYCLSNLERIETDPNLAKEWANSEFSDDGSLKGASGPEIAASVEQAKLIAASEFKRVIDDLNGPEDRWLAAAATDFSRATASIAQRLADSVAPILQPSILAEERTRTRLRIAYLTLRAIHYYWEAGRLPKKLSDFTTADERVDPTNRGNFAYVLDLGWFKIDRSADDALGKVALDPNKVALTSPPNSTPTP